MKKKYWYKIYDLIVESEVIIPQATVLENHNKIIKADVSIRLGDIPLLNNIGEEKGYGSWIKGFEAAWFNTEGTAQYFVSGGNSIIIKPYPDPNEKLLTSMILSAGLSLVLLQRNEPVLHGSVIEKDGKAYIISGDSGAGKSTVTMELLKDEKVFFMADDTVRLTLEDGIVYCHPTYPQQKVCRDLACSLGLDLNSLVYIDEGRDKFALKRNDKYIDQKLPLEGMFVLSIGKNKNEVKYKKMQGIDYAFTFINNLYLSDNYKKDIGIPAGFMDLINILYKQMNIYMIIRPKEGNTVQNVTDTIRFLQSC